MIKMKIGIPFSAIGGLCLAGGLFWGYNSAKFAMNAVEVIGKIAGNIQEVCTSENNGRTRSYTCYRPKVSYAFKEQSFNTTLSETSSSPYNVGGDVEVLLDPSAPGVPVTQVGLWIGPIFLSVFGLIFGGIGGLMVASELKRRRLETHLRQHGMAIDGTVTGLDYNRSITVNGNHPLKLVAQFQVGGRPFIAKIDELWHDPQLAGQIGPNGEVRILYNPQNPMESMIDLDVERQIKKAA